mmetsp:Transcript_44/g.129  ORF Transcript_44/g.129 Transcript_44/m.129 type:complete len:235 (+) Transcript_44:402-1106(+)
MRLRAPSASLQCELRQQRNRVLVKLTGHERSIRRATVASTMRRDPDELSTLLELLLHLLHRFDVLLHLGGPQLGNVVDVFLAVYAEEVSSHGEGLAHEVVDNAVAGDVPAAVSESRVARFRHECEERGIRLALVVGKQHDVLTRVDLRFGCVEVLDSSDNRPVVVDERANVRLCHVVVVEWTSHAVVCACKLVRVVELARVRAHEDFEDLNSFLECFFVVAAVLDCELRSVAVE